VGKHLPHRRVLRENLQIVFQRRLCLWVFLSFDQAAHQCPLQERIEWVLVNALPQHHERFLSSAKFVQCLGEVTIHGRLRRANSQRVPKMIGSLLIFVAQQVFASQRGLHQFAVRFGSTQLIENFQVWLNVLRFVGCQFTLCL
jgi:hypothetical protein